MDSQFTPRIALYLIPRKFVIPIMSSYDGSGDPSEHLSLYKQKLQVCAIPIEALEVVTCKSFGTTLIGLALKWLISLPRGSIGSYGELVNLFLAQFASNRKIEKNCNNLFHVHLRTNESL